MAEIIKVYKEQIPTLRFIGKCYTDNDRDVDGGFGGKWGEWFGNGWIDELEKLGKLQDAENGYLGFMRCQPNFEYWIGIFLPPDTVVPDGYDFMDMDEGDIGVCWIKGKKGDSSIFWMHEKCLENLSKNGMDKYRTGSDGRAYFFERYNCPRYTEIDEQGNIVLDYGIYLA